MTTGAPNGKRQVRSESVEASVVLVQVASPRFEPICWHAPWPAIADADASALASEMHDPALRYVPALNATRGCASREVELLKIKKEALIKGTNRFEHIAADQLTCAGKPVGPVGRIDQGR